MSALVCCAASKTHTKQATSAYSYICIWYALKQESDVQNCNPGILEAIMKSAGGSFIHKIKHKMFCGSVSRGFGNCHLIEKM